MKTLTGEQNDARVTAMVPPSAKEQERLLAERKKWQETLKRAACCGDMLAAMQHGTDNEGWGALVGWSPNNAVRGKWEMGDNLRPFVLCPWCGSRKTARRRTL